jgi:hypothetical protein
MCYEGLNCRMIAELILLFCCALILNVRIYTFFSMGNLADCLFLEHELSDITSET